MLVVLGSAWAETPGSGEGSKGDSLPAGARARLGSGRLVHAGQLNSIAFSADSKKLIGAGYDGSLYIWDAATGASLHRLQPQFDGNPNPGFVNPYGMTAEMAPDNKIIAVTMPGRQIMMYDADTGKLLRQVGEVNPQGNVVIRFSPDSKQFLAMSRNAQDRSVRLFDAESGKELRKFEGHENFGLGAAFAVDGKHLVTGSEDQSIRLWDVETGKEERLFEGHRAGVFGLAFSPDGKTIASASSDFSVRIWNVANGELLQSFPNLRIYANMYANSNMLRFSPDGKVLTACTSDGIHQWETSSGKVVRKPKEAVTYANGLFAMSSDEKLIARYNIGQIGGLSLLDGATEKELFQDESLSVVSMAISPDSKLLATGGADKIIRLWDMATAKEVRKIEGHTGSVSFLGFLPDGKSLASGSRDYMDRIISIWDTDTGKERRSIRTNGQTITAMSLSQDGHTLAYMFQDIQGGVTVRLMDPETKKEIHKLTGLGYNYAMALSPDGKSVTHMAPDGTMVLHDAASSETKSLLRGLQGMPTYSPDGRSVAISCWDGIVRLIDTASVTELRQFGEKIDPAKVGGGKRPVAQAQMSVGFSADARMLATVGKDGIVVWEVTTAKARRTFSGGHQGAVSCIAFSPDGKTLVSASQDGQVFFWDLIGLNKEDRDAADKLTAKDADRLWNDLQSDDAAKADHAMRLLRGAPKVALTLLQDRLKPAAGAEQEKIDKLIADLDSEGFDDRAKATQELENLGEIAEPALRKALEAKPSLEASQRIEELLQKFTKKTFTPEKTREDRALEVLEHMGGEDARSLLEKLAGGVDGAWMTQQAKVAMERAKAAAKSQ
jgi:WD40 repeat protein